MPSGRTNMRDARAMTGSVSDIAALETQGKRTITPTLTRPTTHRTS